MATLQNYNVSNTDSKKIPPTLGYPVDGLLPHDEIKGMIASGSAMMDHIKNDAIDLTKSAMSEARSFTAPYIASMEKEVKFNPLRSVAIAFGTGALLSFLFRRT